MDLLILWQWSRWLCQALVNRGLNTTLSSFASGAFLVAVAVVSCVRHPELLERLGFAAISPPKGDRLVQTAHNRLQCTTH